MALRIDYLYNGKVKMKQLLTVLIVLAVSFAFLVGCAQKGEPQVSGELESTIIEIPIQGLLVETEAFQVSTFSIVVISDEDILSLTELSADLSICWYIDNGAPKCAYRRYSGDWIHFITENSAYRDGYGAELYSSLFGHSGFYIKAPRGSAYFAHDYYYFGADGSLKFLYAGTYSDMFVDFNNDDDNELLYFYHGGRDAGYCYAIGDDIFMFI